MPTPSASRGFIAPTAIFLGVVFVLNSILLSTPATSSIHGEIPVINQIGDIVSIFTAFNLLNPYRRFLGLPKSTGDARTETLPWPGNPTSCAFPLPNLLTHKPIKPGEVDHPIQDALDSLDHYLVLRTSVPDIDSLSIAVVTPSGAIFERGYGVLKANETEGKPKYPVGRDSIYRIASISKMFAVFEALLLREKGSLNLDDPVDKYIPDFKPPSKGWREHLQEHDSKVVHSRRSNSRITLRQLAGHTSGLGRDYPVNHLAKWPVRKLEVPISDERNTTLENVLGGIHKYPLVNLPHSYPIYSNVGFDMLGLALVAANLKAKGDIMKGGPKTYKELIKQDIFDPFGLNSSFFRVPENDTLKDHMAVPSQNSQWAGIVLGDVDDAAGGQYSSLADLSKMAQIFLSASPPSKEYEYLPEVVREWLRPSHVWPVGGEAVGAPWEISSLPPGAPGRGPDAYTGNVPIYSKSGNLPGYHSIFSLNPQYGYSVIVLVTGTYSKTDTFAMEALRRLQPAFQEVLVKKVTESYVGSWEAEGEAQGGGGTKRDMADVRVISGQLFLTALVVDGVDVVATLRGLTAEGLRDDREATFPIPLWSTGRPDEFRMALGRGPAGAMDMYSCAMHWATIDFGFFSQGASVDLLYWEDGELVYPSAGVKLKKRVP